MDQQFTETQVALDAMFKLPNVLSKAILLMSENDTYAQELVQSGLMWRVIYLLTLYGHFITQDEDDRKSTIQVTITHLLKENVGTVRILIEEHSISCTKRDGFESLQRVTLKYIRSSLHRHFIGGY